MRAASKPFKAWQQPTSQARVRKARYASPSAPPITSTISLHSFMGGGKGFGSRPSHSQPVTLIRKHANGCRLA